MIAYTAFLLFLIGVFCCVKATVKFDRILSYLTITAVLMTFALFLDGMYVGAEDTLSFVWNSSPSGDIKIDIISNAYNYELVYPFFIATLIMMLGNTVFRLEKNSGSFNAIVLFNLVAVILMLTSTNFVQLLAALFITDILALFIIKNTQISRRYIMMNILADMLVFAMIAIINSRIKSLDIRQILRYNQIGFYPDFVAVCGLTAVFIRFGFFLFHIGICALKEIRLHGLVSILLLFSPLSALILLLKFHVVWQNSQYFLPYLNTMCIVTSVWGLWRCLTVNAYKAKIIYGQMMFWPLLIELLRFNGFIWDSRFTAL
ncbi:MAG: hypothetical protein J6Y53_02850, partial [Alphaproteobacteria bacterium]|nr:hypothetical protein [Alphaproteobacteria bacterium]